MKKNKTVRLLRDVTFDHDSAEISLTTNGAASLVDSPYLLKSLHTKLKEENVNMKKGKLLKVLKGLVEDVETLSELEAVIEETVAEAVAELEEKVEELQEIVDTKELEEKSLRAKGLLEGFGLDEATVKGLSVLEEEALDLVVAALGQVANVEKKADEEELEKQDEEEENDIAKSLSREIGHLQKQRVEQGDTLLARVRKLKNK